MKGLRIERGGSQGTDDREKGSEGIEERQGVVKGLEI